MMNLHLFSTMILISSCYIASPLAAEEPGSPPDQQAQPMAPSPSATSDGEHFAQLIENEPSAAGQPNAALSPMSSRKWHSPDGTRTWRTLHESEETVQND